MTVAVACKLSDGVILGVDSAVSITVPGKAGEKTFDNADKLARLSRRPVGVANYDLARLGNRSISNYLKEFEADDPEGTVSSRSSMSEVVEALRRFFLARYKENISAHEGQVLGLIVGGFSHGQYLSEVRHILIPQHEEPGSAELVFGPDEFGVDSWGADEPIRRYLSGYDDNLVSELRSNFRDRVGYELPEEDWKSMFGDVLANHRKYNPYAHMPLREGIEYTRWLVELVINHYRFAEVSRLVGGEPRIGAATYAQGEFLMLTSIDRLDH
jgi:hypothetical protein